VIQPDPGDDGPDGFNVHDWNGDGRPDVLVNFEEGGFSRLYFHPGAAKVRELWTDFIEFPKHGTCEDSGIGDLDQDGFVDYVANGGHVYFHPGPKGVRDPARWTRMTLFMQEARCPAVDDVDGDGLADLIVGARAWYKQPATGKHEASRWTCHELGAATWPMTCLVHDMDGDGDADILVQERKRQGTFYYENPGPDKVGGKWPVHVIDPRLGGMFLAMGDVNGDGRSDLVVAASPVRLYLRGNDSGPPVYHTVEIDLPPQPGEVTVKASPKGVALLDMNSDPARPEIVIIPEYAAQLWYVAGKGDGMDPADWTSQLLGIPGPATRKKMDNAWLCDLDGDGDMDIGTTEENGGWGVIWFENPAIRRSPRPIHRGRPEDLPGFP
jgi:hypothetical protein